MLSSSRINHNAIEAARTAAAFVHLPDWGLLEMTGPDRLDYLHNQTTNNIKELKPNTGCETCVVTTTARVIDLTTVLATETSLLISTSPRTSEPTVFAWLKRLIPFSNAQLADLGEDFTTICLFGPQSQKILEKLAPNTLFDGTKYSHQLINWQDEDIRVTNYSLLSLPGFTLFVPKVIETDLIDFLNQDSCVQMSTKTWNYIRLQDGRPMPDTELTQDYNPLEAGLWQTAHFNKGCYIGQETIARLKTYDAVKQQLWGVALEKQVPQESTLFLGEERIGKLTSVSDDDENLLGLAYIRKKFVKDELEVADQEGNVIGKTFPLPFSFHSEVN